MIGRLRGIILEKKPPQLILDVNGVGYEVAAPMSTFYHLPDINQTISLYTHFVVREDAQLLYGFYHERERTLFRALIKVNGVGPKLALTILSGIEADHFVQCIIDGDASNLIRIPGIGKKTAERLIIETRDVLTHWENSAPNIETELPLFSNNQTLQDAIDALISLGYKAVDAKKIISDVHAPELTSEDLIRLALKQMVKGK